jgi:hypothetical protein
VKDAAFQLLRRNRDPTTTVIPAKAGIQNHELRVFIRRLTQIKSNITAFGGSKAAQREICANLRKSADKNHGFSLSRE